MRSSRLLLVTLLLMLLAVLLLFLPVRQWVLAAQPALEWLGPAAPIVFTLLYIVFTVLLIPGSALTFSAGLLFGFKIGFFVVLLGANGGALAAFLLARTLLRERVARWAAGQPKFAALDRAIGQNGFKMVFLSRLSPAFPFTLLNYLLGLTTVRTSAYVLANFLGMLPGTFLYVYLSAAARDAITATAQGEVARWQNALKVAGVFATILIVVLITRIARQAIAQAERDAATDD